jgi:hypothetical protein
VLEAASKPLSSLEKSLLEKRPNFLMLDYLNLAEGFTDPASIEIYNYVGHTSPVFFALIR